MNIVIEILGLISLVMIFYGFYLIYPPFAFIVVGVILFLMAVVHSISPRLPVKKEAK